MDFLSSKGYSFIFKDALFISLLHKSELLVACDRKLAVPTWDKESLCVTLEQERWYTQKAESSLIIRSIDLSRSFFFFFLLKWVYSRHSGSWQLLARTVLTWAFQRNDPFKSSFPWQESNALYRHVLSSLNCLRLRVWWEDVNPDTMSAQDQTERMGPVHRVQAVTGEKFLPRNWEKASLPQTLMV